MSFRNKLFYTNLKVAILPIVFFVVIIIGLFSVYRHYYHTDFSNSRLTDETTLQLMEQLKETNPALFIQPDFDYKNYEDSFLKYGFTITVLKDSTVLYEGSGVKDTSSFEEFIRNIPAKLNNTPILIENNHRLLFLMRKDTLDGSYLVLAISKHSRMMEKLMDNNLFYLILLSLLVALAILICWICSRYSRHLTKQLMLPILKLGEGANRIQQGNLDLPLEYDAMDEFQPVFDSFNNMQTRLKESILLALDHEKKQQKMVAEISHDLKTPLTAIKGYVKGLEDGIANTPQKQEHYLRKIRTKTDDMTHLIDESLMFSKLERGKIVFHTASVLIDSYLLDVLAALQEDYQEQALDLTICPNTPNVSVLIDSLQFNRVLENIIENSLKYSNQATTKVTVTTRQEQDHVVIVIKDQGPGVDEDKLLHIFETFYRADDSRNNPTSGSGLGLAISSHIIKQLSGTISAYNAEGLAIQITLPIVKGDKNGKNINY